MGLLNWFSRSKRPIDAGPSSGLSRHDPEAPAGPVGRRSERTARRELLYTVVRECMIQASVLSSHYRFKVLSLDKHGRQFLLMVDLDGPLPGGAAQLAQIEAAITAMARVRHDLLVKAVYWRQGQAAPVPTLAKRPPEAPAARPAPRSAFEPIDANEVAAFRQALAAGASRPAARAFDGHVVHGPQSYTLLTGFEDTELPDARRTSELSTTQPGELR